MVRYNAMMYVCMYVAGLNAQLDALQDSAKSEQARHWEEVKKHKQAEAQLLEEADKLSQELHEKTLLLHSSENERAGREAGLRSEAAGAGQMAATLKAELERR
jgi:hypothetical protein